MDKFDISLFTALDKADYVSLGHEGGSTRLYEFDKDNPKTLHFYHELSSGDYESVYLILNDQTIQIDQASGGAIVIDASGQKHYMYFFMRQPFGPDDI